MALLAFGSVGGKFCSASLLTPLRALHLAMPRGDPNLPSGTAHVDQRINLVTEYKMADYAFG
jgi:hypothetical protein